MAGLGYDSDKNIWHYDSGKHVVELRPLHRIHDEVYREWTQYTRVQGKYSHAWPYMMALRHLNTPATYYGPESGDMIVARFLDNATAWRGEAARRVKAELKAWLEAYNKGLIKGDNS